jgi:CTP:molybdopterin cytidylyltransferase MocA
VKSPVTVAQGSAAQGRERILLVALGDHLQRSQMVLVELVNATPGDSSDIRIAQERARNLVSENRLYRQTASLSGDNEFLGLLDELERVLTDVANSPERISSPELQQIQQRIESRGLIFKIRVTDSNLQQKGVEKL